MTPAETAKAIIARANLFSGAPCEHTNVPDLDDHCAGCVEEGIAAALRAERARSARLAAVVRAANDVRRAQQGAFDSTAREVHAEVWDAIEPLKAAIAALEPGDVDENGGAK